MATKIKITNTKIYTSKFDYKYILLKKKNKTTKKKLQLVLKGTYKKYFLLQQKNIQKKVLISKPFFEYPAMFVKLKKNKNIIKKLISVRKKFIKIKKQYDITGATIKIIDNSGADLDKLYEY